MSSNITLSQAVRSNLLSLQNTASLLDTTQTRLATGNKVNTALDNPTSYFTASSLNARASDLGNLLDSVSNAVQTIQAANDGITSITKLVESAQATANQAQQLQTQIAQVTGATAGAVTAGAFTTIDVSGTSSSATSGTLTGGSFTAVNVSGTGSAATAASFNAGAFSGPVDISGGSDSISFQLTVDGGSAATITINSAAVTAYNTANSTTLSDAALSATDLRDLINDQAGAAVASVSGGNLVFTSTTSGASSAISVASYAATISTGSTGIANNSDTGSASVAADSLSFTVTADGGSPTTVTLSAAAVSAYNTANSTSLNAASLSANDVRDIINDAVGSTVASVSSGNLVFTSTTSGASSSIATSAVTAAGAATNTTGITAASNTGSAAAAADSISFTVTLDGGSAQTVTLSAAAVTAYNTATSSSLNAGSLSAANVAAIANQQLGATVATVSGGALVFTSTTTGTSSTAAVSAVTNAGTPTGSTGVSANSGTGAASSTTNIPNPARGALLSQYNSLLDQIDQLTSDASYNGNNLLSGTSSQLKVLFNETGTSSLTVSGKDTTFSGLGLAKLTVGTEFDTNASITTVLGKLKTATDTLRSDASSFGSSLSIVQTRQEFTKHLINTLQTGASNLTLADSNEEAANLLALQTRQSLSTKALSLASQSDQNVLRLLQ